MLAVEQAAKVIIGGRYRLERLLGEGGMGAVWAAEDLATGRRTAVKLMKDPADDADARRRFLREGRAASAVRHPNVVSILDVVDRHDGPPAIVMELLEGESLRERLRCERTLSLTELADIMVPVVSAVGAAHALGIVHRDLKPANIFLAGGAGGSRVIKVLDFGIAKLTALDGEAMRSSGLTTGAVLGTPAYMAPEQVFAEKDLDHRADIWALGIILYECLAGVCPTGGENVGQILKHVVARPFEPLEQLVAELPEEIARLVARMLERERSQRPADLHEVLELLEPFASTGTAPFGVPAACLGAAGIAEATATAAITAITARIGAGTTTSDEDGTGEAGELGAEAYCPACGRSFPPELELCPDDRVRLVRLAAAVDPLIGRVFEQRYEIRSRLGEGGMGAVYRGWQLSVDREVAIKVIDPKLSGNRGVVKRFLREARLSSRLGQPSIVNLYDFGQTEDGILYIVMELLRGHTLARELDARGELGLDRTIHIGVQLCDALDAAHAQGIVHRDLKPGNVMILDEPAGRDFVKVLDFGLAKSLTGEAMSKITHTDAVLGTPLYMSPEQIDGQPSDQRADLYSLGCMLYEMLSGRSPFADATTTRVMARHLREPAAPLPAHVPRSLAELISRLMAKHPDQRPQSAADVRSALLRELGPPPAEVSVASESPIVGTGAAASRQRHRWLGLTAAAALGALAVAIALVQRAPADEEPAGASAALGAIDTGIADASVADAAPPVGAVASPPPMRVDSGRVAPRPARQLQPQLQSRPQPPQLSPPSAVDAAIEIDFYKRDAAP